MLGAALAVRTAPADTAAAAGRAWVFPRRRPDFWPLLVFGQVPGRQRLSFFAEHEPRFGAAQLDELAGLHAELMRAGGCASAGTIFAPERLPATGHLCGIMDFQLPAFPAAFDQPVTAWMTRLPGRSFGLSRAGSFQMICRPNPSERLSDTLNAKAWGTPRGNDEHA